MRGDGVREGAAALVDLFAVDGHRFGGGEAQANLVALDGHDGDTDVVVNHHGFADAVERFLEREGEDIEGYLSHLDERSPFKSTG